ncbi:hypothetical protein [Streptomyces sp. PSKA30]|uniref:hypothetical protein n=1 Tax=Streptomyces sp. PSKA30 TaxID=2874597 RepID=UPI001CD16335|nr:hypothetical protein [Streptomyces sp. PSKA30]MBZ9639839.1 hypothetical protein [Streptomyces sp. PSKA30]
MLKPAVAFDTVGFGVHNVSAEESGGTATHRGRLVSLRAQKPRLLTGLALYDRFIWGLDRSESRHPMFGRAQVDVLECLNCPKVKDVLDGRWRSGL